MYFVNTGLDECIVQFLEKSYPGTVATQVWVNQTKDGKKAHMTTVYKKPDEPTRHAKHSKFVNPKANFFNVKTKQVYTFDQVKNYYDGLPKDKRHGFENFIKTNYFVSDGKSTTSETYKKPDHTYTYTRFNMVHKPIIDKIVSSVDSPPDGMKPVAVLIGGGAGSGKSTVISSIVKPFMDSTGLKFANMDCDELKPLLPEFPMFLQENPKSAYSRVHRESSDLCGECLDVLMKQSKCFMFSGIMGDAQRTKGMIDKLNKLGYEVHLVCIDVPIDLAISRASKRDRFMSDSIITTSHRKFASAFNQLFNYPGVSSCELYDNSQPPGQPPTLIMDQSGVHNQTLYNNFMKKSKEGLYHGYNR